MRPPRATKASELRVIGKVRRGVTGTQQADADAIAADIRALKADTDLPVCIGFGIRDGVTARRMAELADGVVIGGKQLNAVEADVSALVQSDVGSPFLPTR